MRILYGILFALLVALGCQKEPQSVENTQAYLYAIPDGQAARLNFYLVVNDGNSPIGGGWGRLEPNARFDVVETDEMGKEIKTWAQQVAPDTFRLEGLELGRLYYFKVKAYLGRNYITESPIVCVSTKPLPKPTIWIPSSTLLSGGGYEVISPSGQNVIIFQSIDTLSSLFLYEFNTGISKPIPILVPIQVHWNNTGDKILIHTYSKFGNGLSSQLYLYDLPSGNLTLLTPETDAIILSPHFTPDYKGVYFFTNNPVDQQKTMWCMALDGTGRTTVFPQLSSFLNAGNYTIQNEPTWDAVGENAYITLYDIDYNYFVFHFNTLDNSIQPILQDDTWNEYAAYVSPNGKKLLVTSTRSGINELWLLDLPTGQLSQISNSFSSISLAAYYGLRWIDDTEFYIAGISGPSIQHYKVKI